LPTRRACVLAIAVLAVSCARGGRSDSVSRLAGRHPAPTVNALIGGTHSRKLSGFRLLDLSFVDSRHGFALGGFFGSSRSPLTTPVMAVLGTTNGGRSWETVGAPPEPVAHVEFGTPSLGWAFGPHLFVTRNGGQTWERERAGGPPVAVAASGRSVRAATGTCRAGGQCALHVRVSDDAGRSWRTPRLPAAISNERVEFARVGRVGWVVGSTATPHADVSLLRTTDGGQVWRQLRDPCDGWFHYGISFKPTYESHLSPIDADRLWLLCTGEPAGGSADGVLFTSADSGSIWHLIPVSVGGFASVRHAVQRGRTWADLQFVDPRHGWVATGTTVYRTSDGGAHWVGARLHPSGCG
jgi:hypothetical protein